MEMVCIIDDMQFNEPRESLFVIKKTQKNMSGMILNRIVIPSRPTSKQIKPTPTKLKLIKSIFCLCSIFVVVMLLHISMKAWPGKSHTRS